MNYECLLPEPFSWALITHVSGFNKDVTDNLAAHYNLFYLTKYNIVSDLWSLKWLSALAILL